MTAGERTIGDVTILDVQGRMTVDAPREKRVVDRVRSLLQQGRQHLVLNLERVSQIDSAGLCDLVTSYTTTVRQGGSLKLIHLHSRIRELLVITKILSILEVYDSEEEAVASFASGPPA